MRGQSQDPQMLRQDMNFGAALEIQQLGASLEAAGNGVNLERLSPQQVKQMEPEARGHRGGYLVSQPLMQLNWLNCPSNDESLEHV